MAKPPKPPTKLDDVFKDKELTDQFEEFCKREYVMENFTFYQLKSWNAQNVYKLYFKKGAKYELNVSGDLIKETRELGEKKAWDDNRWKELVKEARVQIVKLMERDTFKRFLKTLKTA